MSTKKSLVIIVIACTLFGISVPGCDDSRGSSRGLKDVSMSQYNQLQDGMSYAEVSSILGPGAEQSRTNIAGYTSVTYTWSGNGHLGSNMVAVFQNDRLVSRAQIGLR